MNNLTKRINTDIQDQSTRLFEFMFKRFLESVTLASPTTLYAYTINLVDKKGFVAGDYVALIEGGIPFQARVLSTTNNTLNLDRPLARVYTVAGVCSRTSVNLNVDGSATPIIFNINPIQETEWHINAITITMTDDTVMDDGKFGGLTALTRGLLLRHIDGSVYNIGNYIKNECFSLTGWEVRYEDKAPQGVYGITLTKRMNGQENSGVTIHLKGQTADQLQLIIQDDLRGLTTMRACAIGHFVKK